MYNNPIKVKATNPIVTPILDEPQRPTFDIVNVYVEMPNPEVRQWILVLEDSSGERFRYNLTFS
jgi:hypothetical protein